MKGNYQVLARFYDDAMGDRFPAHILEEFIQDNAPHARSMLELACGTGTVLKYFSKTFAGNNITNWNIKVFEYQHDNLYQLFEENIQETSFPYTIIQQALQKHFSVVNIVDSNEYFMLDNNVNLTREKSLAEANRLYFICKKSETRNY